VTFRIIAGAALGIAVVVAIWFAVVVAIWFAATFIRHM
jgi:hypothetical protein